MTSVLEPTSAVAPRSWLTRVVSQSSGVMSAAGSLAIMLVLDEVSQPTTLYCVGMGDVETVNAALAELAARLQIPCDVIAVHRTEVGPGGREKKYASLRYGAFLLAYAPFEGFFENLTDYRKTKNRVLGLSPDKIRGAVADAYGVKNVTSGWAARTRSAPVVGTGGRSPWVMLEGRRLHDYLGDMKTLRDLLSHGRSPEDVTNAARTLHQLASGKHSIRLMGVEGFIQVIQDIASETALAIVGPSALLPAWPAPPSTGASDAGRLPRPY
jgi:hypothetical protein